MHSDCIYENILSIDFISVLASLTSFGSLYNSFDTLNKTKASFIINEIGKPCEDNYTKVIIFNFDNQNEFKVNSFKNETVV